MASVSFRPDIRYRTKLLLILGLAGAMALAGSAALGALIGSDVAGAEGVLIGLLVPVLANLAWLVPGMLLVSPYYRSLRYEIHDEEVIVCAGIVTRSVKHVPFRTVTNLKVSRGPLDRLLGIGTLHVETAGMSGQTGAEQSLVGLPDVQAVYEQVAEALRRFRGAMAPNQAEEEPADGQPLPAILEEIRAIRRVLEQQHRGAANE